jgi:hypothetical protein
MPTLSHEWRSGVIAAEEEMRTSARIALFANPHATTKLSAYIE